MCLENAKISDASVCVCVCVCVLGTLHTGEDFVQAPLYCIIVISITFYIVPFGRLRFAINFGAVSQLSCWDLQVTTDPPSASEVQRKAWELSWL